VEDEARVQADGVADGPDDADDVSQDPYTTSEELGGTLSDLKKDGESFADMFERRHKEIQTDPRGEVEDRSLED